YTTAETILEAYADPRVLARSRQNDVDLQEFLDGGSHTLYLSSTVREQRRLRPLFVAFIQSVIQAAYERSAATGEPLDPPLLIVLDEAANIAPLPDLDVLASTGAGQGVQLLTVTPRSRPGAGPLGSRARRHHRQQPPGEGHRHRDFGLANAGV